MQIFFLVFSTILPNQISPQMLDLNTSSLLKLLRYRGKIDKNVPTSASASPVHPPPMPKLKPLPTNVLDLDYWFYSALRGVGKSCRK